MLADEQVPRSSYDDFRCIYQHLEVTSKQYRESSFTFKFRRFFFLKSGSSCLAVSATLRWSAGTSSPRGRRRSVVDGAGGRISRTALSYLQAALELGGHVRKGERGTKVYVVKQLEIHEDTEDNSSSCAPPQPSEDGRSDLEGVDITE
jgi:hypothetical protein